ncbi:MAG: hypothetical protein ACTSRI_08580 [Promethearchaeota archaeon]
MKKSKKIIVIGMLSIISIIYLHFLVFNYAKPTIEAGLTHSDETNFYSDETTSYSKELKLISVGTADHQITWSYKISWRDGFITLKAFFLGNNKLLLQKNLTESYRKYICFDEIISIGYEESGIYDVPYDGVWAICISRIKPPNSQLIVEFSIAYDQIKRNFIGMSIITGWILIFLICAWIIIRDIGKEQNFDIKPAASADQTFHKK